MNYQEMPTELLDHKNLIMATELPYIKITTSNSVTPLKPTQSKFGGTPFLLKTEDYPKTSTGKSLLHIAQLNFAEMPKLEGFPDSGILQFFIDDDEVYGINLNNMTKQDTFRLKYFPSELVDETKAITDYDWPHPQKYFVLSGEYALTFSLRSAPISPNDYRFNNSMRTEDKFMLNLSDEDEKWYWDNCENTGHKSGGYPFFTQDDPRHDKSLRDYTTLLFQMDTDYDRESKKYKIIWGDAGVANFFIKPQDLAKCDFSNVIYNWDCS